MKKTTELKDLCGLHILTGVEIGEGYVRFTLDGETYKAEEDPCDDYRSYMKNLEKEEQKCLTSLPDVKVYCYMKDDHDEDILVFRDIESNEAILEVGTDYKDGYYPFCVFNYHPEGMFCNKVSHYE